MNPKNGALMGQFSTEARRDDMTEVARGYVFFSIPPGQDFRVKCERSGSITTD
jgi:tRNA(Ser,Leu) C12 N-acetylase TAN1